MLLLLGKTTTTERMLFYSGRTRSLGEVHHGNTVTDYLTQERDRGITICSSAVSFPWKDFKINVLDTPGHIDFTMEVEQSLYAVDGVIIVLDGSAGVEAQTVTVWSQSERHNLPKIIFLNKMDRVDSCHESCLNDIKYKFDSNPMLLQYPLRNEKNGLEGVVDLIEQQKIIFEQKSLGREFKKLKLEEDESIFYTEKRNDLIDFLSGIDDQIADNVIKSENFDNVSNQLIYAAIRKATIQGKLVPVLIGSAYKNIGIQPLLDSVIRYLPHPLERNHVFDCFGNDFAGKVFKIVHDKQKGPLTLVRIFRGSCKKGSRLVTNRGSTETIQRLYEPLADEYKEVSSAEVGDIAVCSGMKGTITGDLLISSITSFRNAQKSLKKEASKLLNQNLDPSEDEVDEDVINEKFALQPKIPDAVYFCSIEPPSMSYQNALENALRQLQREDPSLRVSYDETTGQTVLGGMGELHMDIVKSRILTEYKIEAELGPLQISYKETLSQKGTTTLAVEKEIGGAKQSVTITMSLTKNAKEIFMLDNAPEYAENLRQLRPRQIKNIKNGAIAALERGPRIGGQVINTQILLHSIQIGRGTADPFIMAISAQCVQKILREVGTKLLEPVMLLEIVCPSELISTVINDLSGKRATIINIDSKGQNNKIIQAKAPLAELSGYSSRLRTITSGNASMTMEPSGYLGMNTSDEETAIRRAQGLE
ncbi:ribosome-releasing factor 2, mitochondrial isoform X2 [Condylostylus longicornis]|uniref:ribosome-releasing factor 2, mitochondrial isoform X2 n=1 Tax=Condylostylus longicornis TaxID=2530218 RepID=UPI00244DD536|nr:ribosome-releasing factor 2, mitochondrial isoform X2 [Condylostylus longicornis]